ncbi:hypothetical protein FSP39_006863 [Pinctada imbricata]|uniref:KANL2-like probable zinc-finger domain-containing protein n=1 Tax=Pinctada imbricata TaxID=66713 RepID=A0AA88YHU4_PINIB|nr:hypothetical protein FSP39_006863 [Pinctada imbricata]
MNGRGRKEAVGGRQKGGRERLGGGRRERGERRREILYVVDEGGKKMDVKFRFVTRIELQLEMYEGKNIHYSSPDKKPLCSFSGKVCNQHRLNGYGFCVRHILEDPHAPFKRCAYVAKSSKQTCTQAIPQHEERKYCNNHMQVLGMLPRKERKKKEKETKLAETPVHVPRDPQVIRDNRKSFEDRVKSKFNTSKLHVKSEVLKNDVGFGEDPDDPYAFPDPSGDSKNYGTNGPVNNLPSSSPYSEAPLSVSSQGSHGSKSPGDGGSGVSSIARLYPELAEKLEKVKPKAEPVVKGKEKGKAKSSRTLHRLQTKIAQNRIKDKMKRNQESNSQSQSPYHGYGSMGHVSPHTPTGGMNHYDIDMMEKTLPNNIDNLKPISSQPPSYPPVYSQVVNDARKGYPFQNLHPNLVPSPQSDLLPSPSTPEYVHAGIPQGIPHGVPLESLPGMPNSGYRSHSRAESSSNVLSNSYSHRYDTSSEPIRSAVPVTMETTSTSNFQNQPPVSMTSSGSVTMATHGQIKQTACKPPPPPYTKSVMENRSSISSVTVATTVSTMASSYVNSTSNRTTNCASDVKNPPVTKVALYGGLPPPPPYTSKVQKNVKSKRQSYTPLSIAVVPHLEKSDITKSRKVKHIVEENDIAKKLKTESSRMFYKRYVNKRQFDHSFMGSGLNSSEEEDSSENEEENMLPWQPRWFIESSDDEALEEDEQDDALRTTKLALLRARLRRQCFQSRTSAKSNVSEHQNNNSTTLALIQAIRENPKNTVEALNVIERQPERVVDKYKLRGLLPRQCCNKNNENVQCKNPVLPYTNHCLKHVMYNVDQQIFDYCTAKFADNTQCCMPVFDIRHELPLCMEHAVKADNYKKDSDSDQKQKRPRKKTKPSALTRPPKKGKKKRNQRKQVRPQKPSPPSEATGLGIPLVSSSGPESPGAHSSHGSEDSQPIKSSQPEEQEVKESKQTEEPVISGNTPVAMETQAVPTQVAAPAPVVEPVKKKEEVEKKPSLSDLPDSVIAATLNANLNPDSFVDKGLELPLEQASRLLEEGDFQDVFKLPDEAFDLFTGKNGDYEVTKEDVEELERHLAAANMDIKNAQKHLETLSAGGLELDEEQLQQITATLFGTGGQNDLQNNALSGNMCNGEDQENINAIARSLSASDSLMTRTSIGSNFPNQPATASSGSMFPSISHESVNVTSMGYIQAQQGNLGINNTMTSVTSLPINSLPINSMSVGVLNQAFQQNVGSSANIVGGSQGCASVNSVTKSVHIRTSRVIKLSEWSINSPATTATFTGNPST